MNRFYLDIETGPAPGCEHVHKAALFPGSANVVAIGWALDNAPPAIIAETTERRNLNLFWSLFEGDGRRWIIVGHNIRRFDLPFLIHRSWMIGVTPVPWVVAALMTRATDVVHDTMELWALGTGEMVGLNLMALNLDVPGKTDTIGANFAAVLKVDRPRALAYLHGDIESTRHCYKRLEPVRAPVDYQGVCDE